MGFFEAKSGKKYRRYEIGRYVSLPSTLPYFFEITLNPKTLKQSGILAQILEIFKNENIPIVQLKVSTVSPGQPIRILIAVDMQGKEKYVEKLVKNIDLTPGVDSVKYSPPIFNGVVVDIWSFPPTFQGQRVIFFRRTLLEGMLKEGWRRMGNEFGVLLYYAYFHGALETYRNFYSKVSQSKKDAVRLAEELFRMFGYGILEMRTIKTDEATVRVYDSFECSVFKGDNRPRGAIIRGLIAGWLAGYWNANYDDIYVKETKCIAKGDPYCEYHIWRKK
ncbi:MAG: hypothetical protein J7J67_02220 [Thermoproteales archaeon]|nr:hypothetical protein [Thermoproteales archaeon]